MAELKIKINRKLDKYYVGQVITVPCDEERTPLDQYWRRRLKDAETDGVCEALPEESLQEHLPEETKIPPRKGTTKKRKTKGKQQRRN